MTDHARQWRLSVEGRLADLRAKYGRDLEEESLPAWLDSLEGAIQRPAVGQPQHVAPVRPPLPASSRAVAVRVTSSAVDGGPVERTAPQANFEDLDV